MTIRVGLIGAGRQGLMHVPGLAAMTGVQVAAVCDSDRALAEQAAGPFGAAGAGAGAAWGAGAAGGAGLLSKMPNRPRRKPGVSAASGFTETDGSFIGPRTL